MSARYPHYVYYYELPLPRVFETNAENEEEARRDLLEEEPNALVLFVTTDPDKKP